MKSIPILLPGLSFLLLWASASLLHSGQATAAARVEHHLMPVPARLEFSEGALMIDPGFEVILTGYHETRLNKAAARLVERLARQTGIPLPGPNHGVKLLVHCTRGAGPNPSTIEDESYSLTVTPTEAHLNATTPYGVLRGMETLLQLVEPGPKGYQIPSVSIQDKPRFPWRGLLIDVCRHWIPREVIKRNLDAMAAVKLNVLHWHLSDDQGFRVESKVHPLLHEMGSDGNYYTQDQVREIIQYASDRGIRVVPEFDMPGHTTSWVVGYPTLASVPGPYRIERKWGIHEPELDPTRESVYEFLDELIGEMAALFPDSYFHVGGDEVNGRQWDSNPAIADFKQKQKMKDNGDLQAHFNKRISSILHKHGKKMLGWEEILHPELPSDTVVQSWRGQKSLAEAVHRGYRGLLSSGYYLDLNYPASTHYLVDPIGQETAMLSAEDRAKILGGEACMWGEFVSAETIDSRLWPRLAAIAERLWSPAAVRDVPDMYRRLDITSQRLEWLGIKHRAGYALMLQRLAGYQPTTALKALCDIVEPVKGYGRVRSRPYTSRTPLNRLVDAARPESDQARRFASLVREILADPDHRRNQETIRRRLFQWKGLRRRLAPLLRNSGLLSETLPIAVTLEGSATLGLKALEALQGGTTIELSRSERELLERAGEPVAELLLMVVPPIAELARAASPSRQN